MLWLMQKSIKLKDEGGRGGESLSTSGPNLRMLSNVVDRRSIKNVKNSLLLYAPILPPRSHLHLRQLRAPPQCPSPARLSFLALKGQAFLAVACGSLWNLEFHLTSDLDVTACTWLELRSCEGALTGTNTSHPPGGAPSHLGTQEIRGPGRLSASTTIRSLLSGHPGASKSRDSERTCTSLAVRSPGGRSISGPLQAAAFRRDSRTRSAALTTLKARNRWCLPASRGD